MTTKRIEPPGTPQSRAEAMEQAKLLVDAIYARHSAGCCWHSVLDDCNFSRQHIDLEIESAMLGCGNTGPYATGGPECKLLAELAPSLSMTQFRKLSARDW